MATQQEFTDKMTLIAQRLGKSYQAMEAKRNAFDAAVDGCMGQEFQQKIHIALKVMTNAFGADAMQMAKREDPANLEVSYPFEIAFPMKGITSKLVVSFWSRPESPNVFKAKVDVEPAHHSWKTRVAEFPLDRSKQTESIQFLEDALLAASDALLTGLFG